MGADPPKHTQRPEKPPPSRHVHFQSDGYESTTASESFSPPPRPIPKHRVLPVEAKAKTGEDAPAATDKTSTSRPEETNTQPTNFPALGAAPGGQEQAVPAGPWHTSAQPQFSLAHSHPAFPGGAPYQFYHQQPYLANMAAFPIAGPFAKGVNFQPPVPDTTYGPMTHVYIPRFDNGLGPHPTPGQPMPQSAPYGIIPPGAVPHHVCYPVHYIPSTIALMTAAPLASVSGPALGRSFYLDGYMYHYNASRQSLSAFRPLKCQVASSFLLNLSLSFSLPQAPPGAFLAQQPGFVANPTAAYMPQPAMFGAGQPGHTGPGNQPAPSGGFNGPGGPPAFLAGNTGPYPDVSGLGRTGVEEQARQLQFAHGNRVFEQQEFKPSDDDPSRFYYVRELDGNWTQRSRFCIDQMGDCRWFVTDEGWFYASRLPSWGVKTVNG
ncbi:uncharacterized protein F5Z01DRAFT_637104 [Emericellopsis atlantica]|uniref:Uncharacterized protein n=1 Tax=Emericellopsis atlantica TaxID=2614577 RepID=A0A9P7ZLV2_9HYPO|nr:uncharacterized protein F5Z01DRAFT_637104 [Emericellopsis atlantica]KAG9253893.1 hypothetical protein F5Z01DRAFT_637104 [Emericellopsis atlantica]